MQSFRSLVSDIESQIPDFRYLTIITPNGETSFRIKELCNRIYDYCSLYRQNSICENDAVLIILKESIDLFAAFYAGIIYGALPAYFAYPSPKQSTEAFVHSIENLVSYNKVKIIISFSDVISVIENNHGLLNHVEFVGCFDAATVSVLSRGDLNEFTIPAQEAFLQFSSGTTGAKKGVKISIDALFNQIDSYSNFMEFDENSKVISWLPHYHDMGLIANILMPFMRRVPLYMMSPFEWVKNPKMLLDAITRHKGTHIWLPNFALGHLTKSIKDTHFSEFDLSSVRQMVLCSEPVLYETVTTFVDKFRSTGLKEASFSNCYAMAENTFAMTSTGAGTIRFIEIDPDLFQKQHRVSLLHGGRKVSCVGKPIPGTEVRIVESDGNDLGDNRVGLVVIKSNCMLDGYYNNPEETQKAFVNDWFKTGDLGFFYNSELYITGRDKDIIIVGGENIYPQDVELILNEQENLIPGRNVVFGVNDERIGTERIVVLAEVKDSSCIIDSESLKTRIYHAVNVAVSEIRLLPHMTLKKSTAGKISRYINKNEFLAGTFDRYSYTENAGSSTENRIRALVLKVIPGSSKPHIALDTELLRTGIVDSFAFTELIINLEKEFDIEIAPELYLPELFSTITAIERTIHRISNKIAIPKEELVPRFDTVNCEKVADGGFQDYVFSKSTGMGRFFFEQLIFLVLQMIPSVFGIIARGIFYRFIVNAKGLFGIEENVQICHASKLSLGSRAFIGRNSYLGASDGGITIGDNAVLLDNCYLNVFNFHGQSDGKSRIELGNNVVISRACTIHGHSGVYIGKGTIIGPHSVIITGNHGAVEGGTIFRTAEISLNTPVHIGENVWIGAHSTIAPGVTIGDHSVISAGSTVTRDVPTGVLVGGNPAKLLKRL